MNYLQSILSYRQKNSLIVMKKQKDWQNIYFKLLKKTLMRYFNIDNFLKLYNIYYVILNITTY